MSPGPEAHPSLLSDKQYHILKFMAGIFIPAIGTLYFALASIWDFPAGQEVLGTLIAIQAFLGALLGISSSEYKKSNARFAGAINISETPEKMVYSLDLNSDPEELKNVSEATFKVNKNPQ